jgi:hypothetical protein
VVESLGVLQVCGGLSGSVAGLWWTHWQCGRFSSKYFSFPLPVTVPLMLDIETHLLGPSKAAVAGCLILTDSKQNEVIVIIIMTTTDSEMYINITAVYCGLV